MQLTSSIAAAALLVLAMVAGSDAGAIRRHDGDKVLVFVATNLEQLKWLAERREEEGMPNTVGENIRFWLGPNELNRETVVYVPRSEHNKFVARIPNYGTAWWTVQQENLGRAIEVERRNNLRSGVAHTTYLRYQEILDFVAQQGAICGSFCEVENFGSSFEGRRLVMIRIGDNSPSKKIVWLDAGIHAREWIAPATAVYLIDKLIGGYKNNDAAILALLSKYTFYIAPLLNPDGYEYTFTNNRLWRKTRSVQSFGCRGVDPNRNFGYAWGGKGTSGYACSDIYRGQSAFSESETQAVRDRVQRDADTMIAFITIHSYGQMWLLPYGYDYNINAPNFDQMMVPSRAAGAAFAARGTNYRVGNSADITYPAAGASEDWAHSIGVPYAHCIELPDTGRYGFVLPASEIIRVGTETFEALQAFLNALPA